MKKDKLISILKIIAIIMLLFALADNPYFYYQILRWVTCGLTAYLAYLAYEKKENIWVGLFAVSAILFNPISSFYFGREVWSVLNVIVAAIIFVSMFEKNK